MFVPVLRALLLGVHTRAPDFWKLPYGDAIGSRSYRGQSEEGDLGEQTPELPVL